MQNTPSVDPDFEYFITVNRKLLAFTGCLTFDVGPRTSRGKFISKCLLTWNIIACGFLLSLQTDTLIRYSDDFDIVMKVLSPFIPQIASFLKLLILFYHRPELYELIDRCYLYWRYAEVPEDRAVLKKFAGRGRKRSIILTSTVIIAATLFEASTIYQNWSVPHNGTIHLILPVGVTFDKDSNVYPFAISFEICAITTMAINLTCNTIQQTFMLHGCAHFRLLQSWLGKFNRQELEKQIILDHEEIYMNIRVNLRHHQEILSYCELLDNSFSWISLIEILTTVYNICFAIFNMTCAKTTMDIMKYCANIIYVVLQMLLYCWPATDLSTESMAVANAAYQDFGWVHTKKPIKICILICIARAQKPVLMTALRLSTLSLELFSNAISNGFSTYMVLRNFK